MTEQTHTPPPDPQPSPTVQASPMSAPTTTLPPAGAGSPSDAGPGGPLSSPVPWEQRVAAVGATGWEGVGLSHTDVADYSRAPA